MRGASRPVPHDATTEKVKQTVADLSLLGRRYWIGAHAEGALLFGVDMNVARYRTTIQMPRSLADPTDVEPVTTEATRANVVFDFGTELGWRMSDRWTLFGYAIAGLQPPDTENRFWQPRAGVILRRR